MKLLFFVKLSNVFVKSITSIENGQLTSNILFEFERGV